MRKLTDSFQNEGNISKKLIKDNGMKLERSDRGEDNYFDRENVSYEMVNKVH